MPFRLLIDGALVDGADALDVINPATGKPEFTAPRADAQQLETAIAAARRAFPAWSQAGYAQRGRVLTALADALETQRDSFARLLTREQGKPLPDAEAEIDISVATLRWFAEQALPTETLRDTDTDHILEVRHPLGVVAAIMPWNYPMLMLVQKVAPAMITGNCVIAKPAPTTPLTTLLFGELAADIVPPGVLQVIVDQNDLGSALSSHPGVDCVSFTGSTVTGKKVLSSTADTLKRFSLELGGNDAALILDDANVEEVAPHIFHGATENAGQICLAIKRVYAPRALVDPLCDALARLAGETVVGDGLEQGTTMGPMSNRMQYDKVLDLIADARRRGTIVAGGNALPGEGYFIEPTIVRDLPEDARLVQEEQFGPVLPVQAYDDLDDAIARINASAYGLGGTVWTGDVERGIAVASRIVSGTVWVNRHLDLPFDVPMGGARQSGLGRQAGIEGMKEYTQPVIINAAL